MMREWVFDTAMAPWVDRDRGDEDDARPAPSRQLSDIDIMLMDDPEWRKHLVDVDVMDFLVYAEGMRDCCDACAREANGEDGFLMQRHKESDYVGKRFL